MKFYSLVVLCIAFLGGKVAAQDLEIKESLEANTVCASAGDLHLTSATVPMKDGITVDLTSAEACLFFDNMKPKNVLKKYGKAILIHGQVLDPGVNGRVGMYKQGTVIMPHAAGFQPLEAFTEPDFGGTSVLYTLDKYYSNAPNASVPSAMCMPMVQDNKIRSFKLKRGYMATLANEADGMGYSRVFIADDKDLEFTELPAELDGKISFVRVFKWEYASKKGWAGSVWKEQVEGLKYVEEQCDITNSTWYYNWGATTGWTTNPNTKTPDYGVEFIPEKWGAGSNWQELFGVKNASHVLGYNEPDHTEQSNVSVATAIREWPNLIQTGMRLGSPATTDFSWLYNFMSECKKKNYRVDYVVIHAYWGGLTPDQWYSRMKEVHDRTGRPIWIKEWNNGANWTNESWPSGTEAQQAKQLRDLTGILQVMDTTSWIERYSIYNWVEDKRMMLTEAGKLTPAGEYYAKNAPDFAFRRTHEVIPVWTVREAPVIAYQSYSADRGCTFSIREYNGELIDRFVVERAVVDAQKSPANADYQVVATISGSATEYTADPVGTVEGNGKVCYRVRSVALDGKEKVSNVCTYDLLDNSGEPVVTGRAPVNTGWSLLTVQKPYSQAPVVVLGAQTFVNKSPLSNRVRHVETNSLELKLAAYEYLKNPVYAIPDTVAYLVLPEGTYDWSGVTAQAATVEKVGRTWKTVQFATPFETVPIVFATQVTEGLAPASAVRVKNVTKVGFELALQYERGLDPKNVDERVSYVAATPGTGFIGTRPVEVGCTPGANVGDERTGLFQIDYSKIYMNSSFFAAMQTVNDENTATVRAKERTDACVVILKDCEKSVPVQTVQKEKVGWMVVGEYASFDGVEEHPIVKEEISYDSSADRIVVSTSAESIRIGVYALAGTKLLDQVGPPVLSLSGLTEGVYLVRVNGGLAQKLIKR